jgi:2-phosphosulfolactate phosphatase
MSYTRPTDLPPPLAHDASVRPLHVHLHGKLCDPASLTGGVVIVIDALRASVTITQALAKGATRVIPTLSVDDALQLRSLRARSGPADGEQPAHLRARSASEGLSSSSSSSSAYREVLLLGGERGGVLIPGFDLDNSPLSYTRDRVEGKTIIFTTSNGTAALLHAKNAAEILVGSFANVTAICKHVANDPRPVHILCAGTRDEISLDDILPAGAMVEQLQSAGRKLISDDSGRLAHAAYQHAKSTGLREAMRATRGGRPLVTMGLGTDVDFCSTPDTLPIVPKFDVSKGEIVLAG